MVETAGSRDDGIMSNEPTPDTPDADDSASTPVDPTTPPSSDVPATGGADPTVDVMSRFTPEDDPTEPLDADPAAEDPVADPAASATDSGGGPGEGYVPPQPPPYAAVPPVRRLVRDPYSRLGGVCSGIAHHTGVDVSLVRLGFVLATLFSGIGLILYLLAWLIVPRAEYWPPAPYEAGASGGSLLEGRRLAYGLLAIGIVLVIFSGAGGFARMLVSVALVGAGIWLLVQPQSRSDTAPTGVPVGGNDTAAVPATWRPSPGHVGPDTSGDEAAGPPPGPVDAGYSEAGTSTTPPPNEVRTVYVPSPVPPRRRRIWPLLLIFSILLIPVVAIIGAIAFLVGFDQEFSEADVLIAPATAADIPGRIDEGAGTITLDLTALDIDDFADTSGSPREIEIDLNAGEVTVDLPRDFPVAVDASAGAGEINVGDRYEEGIRPRITTDDPDAVLELDIRVGVGSISVDD